MESYQDYLMIIALPDSVIKQISKYKRASANVIGQFKGMHSTAHISITKQQRCKPFMAQPFILQMERRLMSLQPAQLRISNFSFFKHGETGYTIYAAVNVAAPNHNWFKLLRREMGIKVVNFEPHITVVKNIPPSAFKKLWPYFEKCTYNEVFIAGSLTIFSRNTFGEQKEWRPFKELHFGNRLMAF